MVSSISGIGSSSSMYPMMNETSLTDEQQSTLNEILSQYDPENLTDEDAKSMMDAIRDAGIRPSREVGQTLEAAGFDMEQLKPPAPPEGSGMGGPGGPPPSGAEGSSETEDETSQLISQLLEQIQNGDVSEDDLSSLLLALQSEGLTSTGLFVDQSA